MQSAECEEGKGKRKSKVEVEVEAAGRRGRAYQFLPLRYGKSKWRNGEIEIVWMGGPIEVEVEIE